MSSDGNRRKRKPTVFHDGAVSNIKPPKKRKKLSTMEVPSDKENDQNIPISVETVAEVKKILEDKSDDSDTDDAKQFTLQQNYSNTRNPPNSSVDSTAVAVNRGKNNVTSSIKMNKLREWCDNEVEHFKKLIIRQKKEEGRKFFNWGRISQALTKRSPEECRHKFFSLQNKLPKQLETKDCDKIYKIGNEKKETALFENRFFEPNPEENPIENVVSIPSIELQTKNMTSNLKSLTPMELNENHYTSNIEKDTKKVEKVKNPKNLLKIKSTNAFSRLASSDSEPIGPKPVLNTLTSQRQWKSDLWSIEEENKVQELVERQKKTCKIISETLNRHPEECKKKIKSSNGSPFSKQEDEIIRNTYENWKGKSSVWIHLRNILGRKSKSIREHYFTIFAPAAGMNNLVMGGNPAENEVKSGVGNKNSTFGDDKIDEKEGNVSSSSSNVEFKQGNVEFEETSVDIGEITIVQNGEPWKDEEEKHLLDLVSCYQDDGEKWRIISGAIGKYTAEECSAKYQSIAEKHQTPKVVQGPYSEEEDRVIAETMEAWIRNSRVLWLSLEEQLGRKADSIKERRLLLRHQSVVTNSVEQEIGSNREISVISMFKKGPWDEFETKHLISQVNQQKNPKNGNLNWSAVAMTLQRDPQECLKHYKSFYETNFKKGYFTPAEDLLIKDTVEKLGEHSFGIWKGLEKKLRRNSNSVSKRWRLRLKPKLYPKSQIAGITEENLVSLNETEGKKQLDDQPVIEASSGSIEEKENEEKEVTSVLEVKQTPAFADPNTNNINEKVAGVMEEMLGFIQEKRDEVKDIPITEIKVVTEIHEDSVEIAFDQAMSLKSEEDKEFMVNKKGEGAEYNQEEITPLRETVQIFVKNLEGETLALEVNRTESVESA